MRKTTGSRRQSAFTLIELVVIVTILGILSFPALSRFINVRDAAHSAVAEVPVALDHAVENLIQRVCLDAGREKDRQEHTDRDAAHDEIIRKPEQESRMPTLDSVRARL